METISLYVPFRWTDVHLLRRALSDLGRKTKLVRFAERDTTERENRVNWGRSHPRGALLNSNIVGNKFRELSILRDNGVLVPDSTLERVRTNVGTGIAQWMPRALQHRAASDLLLGTTLTRPAYYVRRVDSVREFRIHVFKVSNSPARYVSIRAGIKVPDPTHSAPHPWIRTLGQGWMFDYGAVCQEHITRTIRDAAKRAVAALQYDFGAVDVGVLANGEPIVFEVNSAPGLANEHTAAAYARHIAARIP